ncbi:MAG: hypothetical protein Q8M76_02115, partial [Spirochaetaceae bacterium]|nr:hypothetical protein [Spirochaetaceae bacterium]
MAVDSILTKKRWIKKTLAAAFLAAASVGLTTCNLFKAGLGARIDINPPTVTITSHQSGAYVGSDFVLRGKATDDVEVKSVKIEAKSDANGESLGVFDASLQGEDWTRSFSADSFLDGAEAREIQLSLTVSVTDTAGKSAKTTPPLILILDQVAPVLTLTHPTKESLEEADSSQRLILNNIVQFRGTANDSIGAVKRVFARSAALGASDIIATGTSSWSFLLDTTRVTTGTATMDLEIVAEDFAGYSTSIAITGIRIDQNLDAPTFYAKLGDSLVLDLDMKAGSLPDSGTIYSFLPGYSFTLTAEDDDALDMSSVDLTLTPQAGGQALSAVAQGWLTRKNDKFLKQKTFEGAVFPLAVEYTMVFDSAIPLGRYTLGIVAKDDSAGKADHGAVAQRAAGEIQAAVVIDNGPPELDVTGVDPTIPDASESALTGAYVKNPVVTGTVTDGFDVSFVTIQMDQGTGAARTATLTLANGGMTGSG